MDEDVLRIGVDVKSLMIVYISLFINSRDRITAGFYTSATLGTVLLPAFSTTGDPNRGNKTWVMSIRVQQSRCYSPEILRSANIVFGLVPGALYGT